MLMSFQCASSEKVAKGKGNDGKKKKKKWLHPGRCNRGFVVGAGKIVDTKWIQAYETTCNARGAISE